MRPFEQLPFAALPALPRRPHPYLGLAARDVRVDSRVFGPHDVRVRVTGSGPPLLLLHGLMTSGYSFRYVVEPLGQRFTCYVPDFVGAGESDKPDRPYTAAALATWILELQRALGIEGCDAIANSMGGYLAMRAALEEPGAFRRLVNVHSPGVPLLRLRVLKRAMSLPIAEPVLRRLVRLDVDRWIQRNVHYYDETLKSLEECGVYGAPLRSDEGLHAFARVLAETLDPDDLQAFVDALGQRRDAGQRFPVPLLLLYAEEDPMVPPVVGERLHALVPDARYVRLPRASHFMHVDASERFLDQALAFLDA